LDLLWIHRDSFGGDNEPEIVDLGDMEFALLDFGVEFVISKSLKDLSNMLAMFFEVVGVDEDVVEVYHDESVDKMAKHRVNVSLESGWAVGEAERHDEIFEEAVSCSKGGLPFVSFGYSDSMVSPAKIDLRVDLRVRELVEEHVRRWQRVAILDGHFVDLSVVDA
jgi:hypothetical protein